MNEFLRRMLALPQQASSFASDVDELHYFIIITTMLGSTVVLVAAVYFVLRYRRRGQPTPTPRIGVPVPIEVAWIGFLLTLFIVWWVIGFRLFVRIETPPPDAMEVYVTGKQWMWKFAYPDGRSSIAVLTVPAGRPVRLNLTSRDVIHSFFVPEFRIKKDALPGRYTTAWFEAKRPGTYQIFCTEYCGVSHSNMWGTVVALAPDDYEAWLEGQAPLAERQAERLSAAERPSSRGTSDVRPLVRGIAAGEAQSMSEIGRDVAARHGCLACHTLDGRRHVGPTWAGLYGRTVTLSDGSRVLADEAYLTESMMDPRAKIVQGFQSLMPTYQGLLSAPEAAALVELIKSLRNGQPGGVFPGRPLDNLQAPIQAPGS